VKASVFLCERCCDGFGTKLWQWNLVVARRVGGGSLQQRNSTNLSRKVKRSQKIKKSRRFFVLENERRRVGKKMKNMNQSESTTARRPTACKKRIGKRRSHAWHRNRRLGKRWREVKFEKSLDVQSLVDRRSALA
jgi:hypothetical protein